MEQYGCRWRKSGVGRRWAQGLRFGWGTGLAGMVPTTASVWKCGKKKKKHQTITWWHISCVTQVLKLCYIESSKMSRFLGLLVLVHCRTQTSWEGARRCGLRTTSTANLLGASHLIICPLVLNTEAEEWDKITAFLSPCCEVLVCHEIN
jgi:hypothetical protein